MRKKLTLEPLIIQYVKDKGNVVSWELVNLLFEKTGVPKEKIEFRIKKMVEQKKLEVSNETISLIDQNENVVQDYDEEYSFGPIIVGRKGNITYLKSKVQKQHLSQIEKAANRGLPLLKEEIDERFQDLENMILEKHDPLDALSFVAAKNLLCDPTIYTESSFQGNQLCPEIIQNIILKNDIEKYKGANRDDLPQIETFVDVLVKKLTSYYMYESITRSDLSLVEKEIYFHLLINFLIVRGDAYPQHYKQISSEFFSRIDYFLKQKGFTIEEYWSTLKEIERQITYIYNEPAKKMTEAHSEYVKYSTQEIRKGTNPEEIIDNYRRDFSEEIKKLQIIVKEFAKTFHKESYEIQANERINCRLLDLLSLTFGDNKSWRKPLDKSDVATKPVIKINGKYYCFLTSHMTRNVIQIIESLLSEKDKGALQYHRIKGDYFEEKALGLLTKLTDGKAYRSLRYLRDCEIDGIIVLNDAVFLVEVKGKKKRIIAGVEDVLRLTKTDFESHVNEAFEQTLRALNFIQNEDEVEFRNEAGGVVLKLRRDSIKKYYLINVCVENFSNLSLDINLVRRWDSKLFRGNQYPWVVSIYDLLVISDLLEKQANAFIDYLDSRIEVATNNELIGFDEIDFLGYFLEYGDLKRTPQLKKAHMALIHGFSEKIDKWYSYLRGEVASAEKPELRKRC